METKAAEKEAKDGENMRRKGEAKMKKDKEKKENQDEIGKKKKTKRKKTIERGLKQMRIYFVNCRGMKSKKESIEEIVGELKPDIFGLVETHLDESDRMTIKGYHILRRDRNKEGGGIIVGVLEKYKKSMVERQTRRVANLEDLWVIVGTKTKYKIGIVYLPKGEKLKKKDQKEIYDKINEEITEGKEKEEEVYVMGDFNAKVGSMISNGDKELNSGGKEICRIMKENKMILINTIETREGTWTRIEGENRSILDYMMVEEKNEHKVKRIKIDEEKHWTPHYSTKKGGEVYTDHCAMICDMEWNDWKKEGDKDTRMKKKMTREGVRKYRRAIEEEKISRLIENEETVQGMYDIMVQKVMEIKEKCEIIVKPKKENTSTRQLLRVKRKLKRSNDKDKKARIKLMNRHIFKNKENRYREKIQKTIEELRKNGGGIKEGTFWEFSRKMKGKREEQRAGIKDEQGEIQIEKENVKQVYKEFYEKLFEKPEEIGMETKQRIEERMKEIMEKGERQEPLNIDLRSVEKVMKGLKRRKAGDGEGWKNELIIEGGKEMGRTLQILFNKILRDMVVPKQWEQMKIKSVYKNKGSRSDMKNRRGIFLTSVVGKMFEKVILQRVGGKISMGRYQNGGRKGRSTKDNFLAMMAVIDRNKRLGEETMGMFADAEKCFDKLWLEDCMVDIVKRGMREREAAMIYEMNKVAEITVITPFGETEKIRVEKSVKQGTIFGPLLCCGSTAEINEIGEKQPKTCITANSSIGALIYVDDIGVVGSRKTIEETGKNLRKMEKEKGFTFNVEKTNIVRIGGKKNSREAKVMLKKGEVKEAEKYKFLGNWINEKGDMGDQIEEMEKKAEGISTQIISMTKEEDLGNLSTEARLVVYERTAIPTIINNLECWTKIREKDMERIERVQGKILKRILKLPKSTPTWGVLKETGIWPLEMKITYHRLMLYQCMVTSEDERLGKEVIEAQEKEGQDGWVKETTRIARRIGVEIDEAKKRKKSWWKKELKEKIEVEIQRLDKQRGKKKERHQKGQEYKRKTYLQKMGSKEAAETLIRRLEMMDIGNNLGKGRRCKCDEKESTEHIIKCKEVKGMPKIKEESIRETERIEEIRHVNEWMKRYCEGRNQEDREEKEEDISEEEEVENDN